jgi:hypothetical protein
MIVEFYNCADENTPEGAFAHVGDHVANHSGLGYWTKIGTGARIGHGSKPGNWSRIGHFAKIGNGVTFGSWAGVGIDAIVDSGCTLGSHEYVRSGYRRRRNGKHERLQLDDGENAIRRLYDAWATAIPSGCYSTDEAIALMRHEHALALELAAQLPAFLQRRGTPRERVSWWNAILGAISR